MPKRDAAAIAIIVLVVVVAGFAVLFFLDGIQVSTIGSPGGAI